MKKTGILLSTLATIAFIASPALAISRSADPNLSNDKNVECPYKSQAKRHEKTKAKKLTFAQRRRARHGQAQRGTN